MLQRSVFRLFALFIARMGLMAIGLFFGIAKVQAGDFTTYGPQNFFGKSTSTATFSIKNPAIDYTLRLYNGGNQGQYRKLSSAVIAINGTQLVGPSDFDQTVAVIEKKFKPLTRDNITVELDLRSNPEAGLTLMVIGNDADNPEIQASVVPASNGAGWHHTDPTVSFICTDPTSSVTACTSPVTVSSEGANQSVQGTAQDQSGNSAETSVTINLDKTLPTIKPFVKPLANGAGWHHNDVTVAFDCADNLSGIASCSPSVPIQTEGAGQSLQGTSEDKAGNQTSANISVNLDKTPPTVTITKPLNGASVGVETLHLEGEVSDLLSGIATVKCNGGAAATVSGTTFACDLTLQEGPNAISVQASDTAGNSAAQAISVTLAKSAIKIKQPANLSFFNVSPVGISGTVSAGIKSVAVNGINAPVNQGTWFASVPLQEGNNTLTAVAFKTDGSATTDSIQVTLDTTPPRVTVESPPEGFKTIEDAVTVTGIVNDVVVGTVNGVQAQVTVNGNEAQVTNRTYSATGIALQPGTNELQIIGTDQVGNSVTITSHVNRETINQPYIKSISGNNQSGPVATGLPDPFVVKLLNDGQPVSGKTVIFKVTENDGYLRLADQKKLSLIAVKTDAEGKAQATLTLGHRAGVGNNIVEAYAVGYQGTAVFTASSTPSAASHINVDAGTNQFGATGSALPLPFVAVVTDAGHNRLGGVPVIFTVKQGGGHIHGNTTLETTSDSDGRVVAVLTLGPDSGQDNNVVEATFAGNAGFPAAFAASAKTPGDPTNTAINGIVHDNSNNPIPGVTMRLFTTHQLTNSNGINNNQPVEVVTPVVTDANGQFRLKPAPVGYFKLMADGATATVVGKTYPTLEYDLITVAGQDNGVGMPIYLPALDVDAKVCVDAQTGGTLKMASSPGFSLTIQPGATTFPGGSKTGCVSVTPVNPDKVPMVPGFGQQPRYVVTIQPVGTTFNPPAAITIPNIDGLQPQAKTEMYSYDHDLAAFVAIGTATVSADGSVIASDPGIGVVKAGWHCGGDPNVTGSGGHCQECQKCNGSACSADIMKNSKACRIDDENGICNNGECQNPKIEILKPTAGSDLIITEKPQMPNFPEGLATITGMNPDPTSITNFNWKIEIVRDSSKCSNVNGRQTAMTPIIGSEVGGQFISNFQEIRGGKVAITVMATVGNQSLIKQKDSYIIKGTNPNKSEIQAALPHDILRKIACHESGQRQFNASSNGGISECPLWSRDGMGGVGIFQLTNPSPSDDEAWNWRKNVSSGKEIFDAKQSNSKGYPKNLRENSVSFKQAVADFNQSRILQGLPAVEVIVPDWTSSGFNVDSTSLGQIELDTIRAFNGYGANHGHYTKILHEFDIEQDANGNLVVNITNNSNQGRVIWYRVPGTAASRGNSGDPSYVDNVLRLSPECQ